MAPALDPVDLVFAKQKLDTLGQPGHAFIFLLHHLGEVKGGFDLDAQVGEFRTHGRVVEFGGMQQGFGWHASDVQTRATEGGASFHAGRFQTQLPGTDCRVVPAGTTAENHDVIGAHGCSPE
ncbi:hypothetical protein D3C81_1243050 [compost metagenome]